MIGETDADVWYRIHLTVRDSIGLVSTTFFDLAPNTVNLTLNTNIPGIQLNLDGQPKDTPYTVEGVVGVQRQLSAASTVTVGGKSYEFTGWSDGGAQAHAISTPSSSTVYTANYELIAVTYLSDLPFVGTPTNGWGPVERDRSNGEQGATDGGPISIRGTTYAKGLGVHSTSQVVFNLAGAYTTFLADLGIDDETNGGGSVVFQVLADGVSIYTSSTILGTTPILPLTLDVTGVNTLTVECQSIDEQQDGRPCRLGQCPAALHAADTTGGAFRIDRNGAFDDANSDQLDGQRQQRDWFSDRSIAERYQRLDADCHSRQQHCDVYEHGSDHWDRLLLSSPRDKCGRHVR